MESPFISSSDALVWEFFTPRCSPGGREASPLGSAAVGLRQFDRKFGVDLLRELPEAPAVYLFKGEDGEILYAGKAKNVRRRLSSYRNAGRRKAHRKMRKLVKEAHSLEVRLQENEREALLVENELIRTHRPRYNVDGAFEFLYPAIGLGRNGHQLLLAFSTHPESLHELGLRWFGVFRSRLRALEAFDALQALLGRLGHREPRNRLPEAPRPRGTRLVAIRRVPAPLIASLRRYLAGESASFVSELSLSLLERPDARNEADLVQVDLRSLEAFFESDLEVLREALRDAGRDGVFVPQSERDALFIRRRHAT